MTKRDLSDVEHRPPLWAAEQEDAAGLDLERLQAELQNELARERGPIAWLRSRSTPLRGMLAGGAVAAIVLATMALRLRPDYAAYPEGRMLAVLGLIAALIVVDLILTLWPLQLPAAPRWLARAAVVAAPLGLFVLYMLPPPHTGHPRTSLPAGFEPAFWAAARCLLLGSAVAAALYALLRGLDRGGTQRLLLMAACAGLAANLMLQLHCPVSAPLHLLIGHLGVLGLIFAAARWLSRAR
ncbi:MAG TPA: hypothetical protein VJR89_35995 [Polyangiales bacterium]|nr:hypothetical protein [Polyangiales bacterium]